MNYGTPQWDRGTTKLRDGRRLLNRDRERWIKAFAGHKRDAHKGKFNPICNACLELKEKSKCRE